MLVFPSEQLVRVGSDIFRACGTPSRVAEAVARSLVDSNLAGHDSHGVIRIMQYVAGIRQGHYLVDAEPRVVSETPATAVVDGEWAFGQETAHFSMELAVRKARETKVAAVSAIRCNHIGRLGEWTELAAAQEMVGLCTVTLLGFGIGVAPYGGASRVLATNPISVGFPRGEGRPPLILDYATAAVAEGKVRVARDKGAQLPPGCILDSRGLPSTEPRDFYSGGMLLPFGGHKGYALSLVVELLSAALGGADLALDKDGRASGSFYLAIDPTAHRTFEEFVTSVEQTGERVVAVPPAPGFEEVLLPGDPEQRSRAERLAHGVPLPEATWKAVISLARELGVETPEPR